jgi:hypothetical protein
VVKGLTGQRGRRSVGDMRRRLARLLWGDSSPVRTNEYTLPLKQVGWGIGHGRTRWYKEPGNIPEFPSGVGESDRSCAKHPQWSGMSSDCAFCRSDRLDPYRQAMLDWADQMEAENASLGPLLALEVRNRIKKVDKEAQRGNDH